ncbi:hypothetical protein DID88_002841 [Monilinia fructigena]|uniref:Uncharacterized protein n=1 Tax=Monilinia fructigena TaxID=38457 RepID=A0A395IQ99_9HELO|nr:hypothetical protein DID88_002841 [Monilinia fructigena]
MWFSDSEIASVASILIIWPPLQKGSSTSKSGSSSPVHASAFPEKPREFLVDFENEREPPPRAPSGNNL